MRRVINLQFPRILLILADKYYVFLGYNYCLLIKQINDIVLGKNSSLWCQNHNNKRENIGFHLCTIKSSTNYREVAHIPPGFGQLLKTFNLKCGTCWWQKLFAKVSFITQGQQRIAVVDVISDLLYGDSWMLTCINSKVSVA